MEIFLRSVTPNDGEKIVEWRNNLHVINHCIDKSPVTEESNACFFNEKVLTGQYIQYMVEKVDEDFRTFSYPIATVYLKDLDNINHKCELGIFSSNDEEWQDITKEMAIKQLLEKAFNEYNFHKIYVYVFSDCLDEIALFKNIGFKREALLKEEILLQDSCYRDIVRLYKMRI